MLKMNDENDKKCFFLGEEGCTVYEDRPWACRMYPLGMALPPARAGVEPDPIFFVFEDDHCKGRHEVDAKEWSAESWRDDQGIEERETLEAGFRGVDTANQRKHYHEAGVGAALEWAFEEGYCDEATRDKDWIEYGLLLATGKEPIAEFERVKQCVAACTRSKRTTMRARSW